jgi:hypothetical protein
VKVAPVELKFSALIPPNIYKIFFIIFIMYFTTYEDPPPPLCRLARPAGWRFEYSFTVTGHSVINITDIYVTVKHQISDTLSPSRHFFAHQKLLGELFQGLKTCMKVGTSDLNHKKNWF